MKLKFICNLFLCLTYIATSFSWILMGTWFLGNNEIFSTSNEFIKIFFALGIAWGSILLTIEALEVFKNKKGENIK